MIESPLFFLVKGQQVSFVTTMGGDLARSLIYFQSPGGTVTNTRVNKKVTNYTTCVAELVRDYKEAISAAAKCVVLALLDDDFDPKVVRPQGLFLGEICYFDPQPVTQLQA